MCSHFKTELILSCPGRPVVFSEVITFSVLERTWCFGVSHNGGDLMVRTKQGTHESEWTWCAGVDQNEGDHMVRTKQGTHGSECTWCAGVRGHNAQLYFRIADC